MKKILALILFTLLFSQSGFGFTIKEPLPVDKAFQFSARVINPNLIQANWQIASGYYLYLERFKFSAEGKNTSLGRPDFPPGIPKEDDILGKYHVYKDQVSIDIPVSTTENQITFIASYQGCASDGFCYPPTSKKVILNLTTGIVSPKQGVTTDLVTPPQSEQEKIASLFFQKNIFYIIFGFLGFGLLLSCTPCVLPMLPILAGIIAGHSRNISTSKAFFLSLVYVLSMSFTYAIAGVIAGFAGSTIQAALQSPFVLITFSLIFVLLAFSLFGFYHIRMPQKLQNKLDTLSRKQKGGSYIGVIIMGILATLIVSPCVTPPLIGALSYIGKTGNAFLGGVALFCLGLGMGIPLLIIGTAQGKFLPSAGPWMNAINAIFGVLMLGVAIWILERIIPGQLTLILWALLLVGSAVYMGAFDKEFPSQWHRLWKAIGLVFFTYGIILIIGATMGNTNPLQPLQKNIFVANNNTPEAHHLFMRIKNREELANALRTAKAKHLPVMLDFYADWCISCKEMEHTTFADPKVIAALKPFMLIQADVTANDQYAQDLQHSLNVIAPPTIIFYNRDGIEMKHLRVVGEMNPQQFLKQINTVKQDLVL